MTKEIDANMDYKKAVVLAKYASLFDEGLQNQITETLRGEKCDALNGIQPLGLLAALGRGWHRLSEHGKWQVFGAAIELAREGKSDYQALDEIVQRLESGELLRRMRTHHWNAQRKTAIVARYWHHLGKRDAWSLLEDEDLTYFTDRLIQHLTAEQLVSALDRLTCDDGTVDECDHEEYYAWAFALCSRDSSLARPYVARLTLSSDERMQLDLWSATSNRKYNEKFRAIVRDPAQVSVWFYRHYPPSYKALRALAPAPRLDFMEREAVAGSMLTELSPKELQNLLSPCENKDEYTDRVQNLLQTYRHQRKIVGLDKPSRDQKEVDTIAIAA